MESTACTKPPGHEFETGQPIRPRNVLVVIIARRLFHPAAMLLRCKADASWMHHGRVDASLGVIQLTKL